MKSIKPFLFQGVALNLFLILPAWIVILIAYYLDLKFGYFVTKYSALFSLVILLLGARRIWSRALHRYAEQQSKATHQAINPNLWKIEMTSWILGLLMGLVAFSATLFLFLSELKKLSIPWRGLILVSSLAIGLTLGSIVPFYFRKEQVLENSLLTEK